MKMRMISCQRFFINTWYRLWRNIFSSCSFWNCEITPGFICARRLGNWSTRCKNCFLYGNLDEELYMEQPEGFIVKGQERKVYRLKKALYGLKQASIAWNKQANKSLTKLGFKRCLSDTGVYTLTQNNHTLVVVLYVDDVLFMENNMLLLKEKKHAFMKMWECRDLGPISEYLHLKIVRDRNSKKLIICRSNQLCQKGCRVLWSAKC